MDMDFVFVDRVNRWSLDVDRETGRTFVGIEVGNSHVDYTEWYAVDRPTFDRYVADPTLAYDFVQQAKNRELDHLLLLAPGTNRGSPS